MNEFTREEMEKCFEAGGKFARDMFNNPSNSEYMETIVQEKQIEKENEPLPQDVKWDS